MTRALGFASRCRAAALVVFVSVTAGRGAAALSEPDGAVGLEVQACSERFESSLRRILRIELRDLLDENSRAESPDRGELSIRCEAELARISARSAGGEQIAHNDLRLGEFPGDAAPRAVALAALEALRAVDPTLAVRIAARPAPGEAPARDTSRASKRTESRTSSSSRAAARVTRDPSRGLPVRESAERASASRPWTRLVIGGVVRGFFGTPRTTTFGARIELSRRFAAAWDAGLDIEVGLVRRGVALGEAEARLISTAGWFGARAGAAGWSATAGLGGRLGLAELRGAPSGTGARGHEVTRPWAGPMLLLRGDGSVGAATFAVLLEGGIAAAGAEGLADRDQVIALTHGWLAASANVGLRW